MRKLGCDDKVACTKSFIVASENFRLIVAVTIAISHSDIDQYLLATSGPTRRCPVYALTC
jgi:hypothetical protein